MSFPSACAFLVLSCFLARIVRRHRQVGPRSNGLETPSAQPIEDHEVIIPIGEVRSIFANKRGVPRQGQLAPSTKARIELFPAIISGDSLQGLDEYSHVWIVFLFSRNSNRDAVQKWRRHESNLFKSKVRPPLLGGRKVGIFASRTPHRPNPLGLTLATITSVDANKGVIEVVGVDLCDGTPVIDIKPFVSSDMPQSALRFPDWVQSGAHIYRVEFAPEAEQMMSEVVGVKFYKDSKALREAIVDVLKLDVRGVNQKRGTVNEAEVHGVVVDGVRVSFAFTGTDTVRVVGIGS
jgi:tRNA-Thr(GGU) m(6)t(6)A37 methyltransferase TsaA